MIEGEDEFDVLKNLKHTNVVELLGSKKKRDKFYMALELCNGSLMDQIKSNEGSLPEFDVVRLVRDLLNGFQYLTANGVYHGDIKPHNVLVGAGGEFKFADSGLSQFVEDGEQIAYMCGTNGYCHPIIFEMMNWNRLYPTIMRPNDRTWPATVDIWSIGVTIFQSAIGKMPFAARSKQTFFQVRMSIFLLCVCDKERRSVCLLMQLLFQIMSQKLAEHICGYENKDGMIERSRFFPTTNQTKFLAELTVLLAKMLKVSFEILISNIK